MKLGTAGVVWLGALASLLATACGGSSALVGDGAADGLAGDAGKPAVDGAAATDAGEGEGGVPGDECDLVAQDCPGGMKCDKTCTPTGIVTVCVPDEGGTRGHAEMCGIGQDFCAKGNFCAIFVDLDGGAPQMCARYCDTAADCPAGRQCMSFRQVCPDGVSRQLHHCDFTP
jgi:hypothetical protein